MEESKPTDTPLLGVAALEILGYAIDPSTRKLEPTKMLLL
jgi:predicted aspartyl protease